MIKYQSKNLNKDKEKICTNDTEKKKKIVFHRNFIHLFVVFDTTSIPFRISRPILEYYQISY